MGYLSTGRDPFTTETYALATENLDIDATGAGWLIDEDRYGKVRLRAESRDGKPVFLGIARTRDAERYLRDVRHDLLTDLEYDRSRREYREIGGSGSPGAPGAERFWAASARGSGTQTLTWDVEHGDWSAVVMNADASRGRRRRAQRRRRGPVPRARGLGRADRRPDRRRLRRRARVPRAPRRARASPPDQSRWAGSGSGCSCSPGEAVVRSARSARLASASGSRASAISEAVMPTANAAATIASEPTGPIL